MSSAWLTPDRAHTWWNAGRTTVRTGDVAREIADDPVSIVVMRGDSDLDAQTVRLLQPTTNGAEGASVGGEEAKADLIVLGTSSLDIQRGDRFLVSSGLYEVFYVSPQQPSSGERLEAKAVQVQ